jgi:hypothetical protein
MGFLQTDLSPKVYIPVLLLLAGVFIYWTGKSPPPTTPGAAVAAVPVPDDWRVGHLGPETCVPLDDIGDHFNRLYYHTGKMRTPADFRQWIRDNGASSDFSEFPSKDPTRATMFRSRDSEIGIFLYNGEALCHAAMAGEKP